MTMPRTFARYLLRTFFARTALVLAALALVLTVFDTLAHLNKVLAGGGPAGWVLIAYAGLRLPTLAVLLAPLAVLLGALLTLIALAASQELVVIRAAGISGMQLAVILLIGAGLVAGAHFAFANLVAVETASRLASWQARDYAGLPPPASRAQQRLWLATDNDIVRIGRVSPNGRQLRDLLIMRREPQGGFRDYLTAESARYMNGRWVLAGVDRPVAADSANPSPSGPASVLRLDPSRLARLGRAPEALSFAEAWALRTDAGYGDHTPAYYRFWSHRKMAQPTACLVMALLAAPLAGQLARRGRLVLLGLATLAAGALYVGLERLLIPLGETAVLPPVLAAWTPAIACAALALWRLILAEN